MDPGTAAILTLSTITGISGYGAMKLNAKRGASIDEEVKKAIGDAQAMIKSAQDAKVIAEQQRNKQDVEVKRLTTEITKMQKAQQQLISEKDVLSKNLESATELEKTYRALSPEVFKQAIQDFMEKPEIMKLEHPEIFEALLSRYSVTRGTAHSLYTKLSNLVVTMIPKPDFDALLLDTLKNGTRSLEQRRAKEAEEARLAKEKSDAEAQAKAAAKVKTAAEAQAAKEVAATEAAAEAAELRRASMEKATADAATRKAAIEKAAKDKAAGEAFARKVAKEKAETEAAAEAAAKKAAQEKGALTIRTPVGGMRKKKLRTRRRDKQNVRRTRRSQNRPNRSHSNTR